MTPIIAIAVCLLCIVVVTVLNRDIDGVTDRTYHRGDRK
jgi:hypothetical protein